MLVGNINNLFNEEYWVSGGYILGNIGEVCNVLLMLKVLF